MPAMPLNARLEFSQPLPYIQDAVNGSHGHAGTAIPRRAHCDIAGSSAPVHLLVFLGSPTLVDVKSRSHSANAAGASENINS